MRYWSNFAGLTVATIAAFVLMAGCSVFKTVETGMTNSTNDGNLKPCPSRPSCVSSVDSDDRHGVAPLRPGEGVSLDQLWQGIADEMSAAPGTTLKTERANYRHYVKISRWVKFRDDIEFYKDEAAGVVQVRSASRVGYYDFDVNRDRVESLRGKLAEKGLSSR